MDHKRPHNRDSNLHDSGGRNSSGPIPNWSLSGVLAEDAALKGLTPGGPPSVISRIHSHAAKSQSALRKSVEHPADACGPPKIRPFKIHAHGPGGSDLGFAPLVSAKGRWILGSNPKADITINGRGVHDQHATLLFRRPANRGLDRRLFIVSRPGAKTKINGSLAANMTSIELKDGDIIQLGESEADFVILRPKDS